MYCLKCGVQLPIDTKEPLCQYCRSQIAKEEIMRDATWAIRIALEALGQELADMARELKKLSTTSKQA
jgi:hypothetical protein